MEGAQPSELVGGKYRLERMIGRGGMGSVWEATHATLGRRVAIKFIEGELLASPEARARFDNEARAAALLASRHVVEVYDHGVTDDGRPYLVMELLTGESLDARIAKRGRLPLPELSSIVTQIARALARAHDAHIVHRDLKPENVFLSLERDADAEVAKVLDFGIAKFAPSASVSGSATRTGAVLGTPFYMSPEQARGLRDVDARSDLWSLGVIAFFGATGRLPFEGEGLGDLLVKICTTDAPTPSSIAPDLPPAFDAWMTQALTREPGARFASAASMAEALAAIARTASPHASSAIATGATVAVGGTTAPYTRTQAESPSIAIAGERRAIAPRVAVASGVVVALGLAALVATRSRATPPSAAALAPTASAAAPLAHAEPTTTAAAPVAPPVVAPTPSASAAPAPTAPHGAAPPARPLAPRATAAHPPTRPVAPAVPPPAPRPASKKVDLGY